MKTAIPFLVSLILLLAGTVTQASTLYGWYIQIQGQTLYVQFWREGLLYAVVPGLNNDPRSTSGDNPFDAVLISGDPTGFNSPPTSYSPSGSFEFSTHSIWYNLKIGGSNPQIDLAFVGVDQNPQNPQERCIFMKPDLNRLTSAEQQIINTFSALGSLHVIYDGIIKICSEDGFQSIYGLIDVMGYDAIGHINQARYKAILQGIKLSNY